MSLTMKAADQCVPEQSMAFVSSDLFSEIEKLFRSYVARRAFTLNEEAGRPNGRDWQHWLQAESEYLFARPKVLESPDGISLFAIVLEKPPRNIEICIAPLGLIIKTKLLRLDAQRPCPAKGNDSAHDSPSSAGSASSRYETTALVEEVRPGISSKR